MRDASDKTIWGQVEKLGKGTKANYDPGKKVITFCFNRSPQTSSELLRTSRELLMKELKELKELKKRQKTAFLYAPKPDIRFCIGTERVGLPSRG